MCGRTILRASKMPRSFWRRPLWTTTRTGSTLRWAILRPASLSASWRVGINEGRIHSEKSAESGIKNRGPDQHHTNNASWLILILGYLEDKARSWLRQHPHLLAFYHHNKFRLITSHLRGLPDFVIIGAMKSGTTSLYDFVIKHPTIAPASEKELHYFSIWYKFGELWYRSNFPTNLSRRYFYKKTGKKTSQRGSKPNLSFLPDGSQQDEGDSA